MRRPPTDLELWITNRFAGVNARESLCRRAEELVKGAGVQSPPVAVAKVARSMGLDPRPIYKNIHHAGSLEIVDGVFRIVIRWPRSSPPKSSSIAYRQMRFTYAHEVAHSIFYDLSVIPPKRLAPRGSYMLEEAFCNAIASHILIPPFLLGQVLSEQPDLNLEIVTRCAQLFDVTFHASALAIEQHYARIGVEKIFILSALCQGVRLTGGVRPRSLMCLCPAQITPDGLNLLYAFQGIQHIRKVDGDQMTAWSLEKLYANSDLRSKNVSTRERLLLPNGAIIDSRINHCAIGGRSRYVWTEMEIEALVKEPRIKRGSASSFPVPEVH